MELAYGRSLPARSRRSGNVPVYGSNGIIGWHDEAVVQAPTVIVGRKGTVGAVHLAAGPSYPIDTTYWVVPGDLEPELAYWTLATLPLQDLNTHAAVPGLHRNDIYAQQLPGHYPPPSRLIALLALIRRRTAVVQRIDRTLRVLAGTLYRGWLTGQLRL